MTRVAICGGDELRAACATLGLEGVDAAPRLVLVDLRDPDAAARAASFAHDVPRIVVATPTQAACLAALGPGRVRVAVAADAAVLGPLVREALPPRDRARTRVVTVTAARGGTGRTLCAANLARRLARHLAVHAIDATGTGALGWWLGADARPWAELEAVASELRPEHLELIASNPAPRLAVVGGAPVAPSTAALLAAVEVAAECGDLVLVDAPALADERTRACVDRSDRVLVLAYADGASAAALGAAPVPAEAWILGSQGAVDDAFRVLPRDEAAVADALGRRGPVSGALGRAYDELAELIAIDAS